MHRVRQLVLTPVARTPVGHTVLVRRVATLLSVGGRSRQLLVLLVVSTRRCQHAALQRQHNKETRAHLELRLRKRLVVRVTLLITRPLLVPSRSLQRSTRGRLLRLHHCLFTVVQHDTRHRKPWTRQCSARHPACMWRQSLCGAALCVQGTLSRRA